ncbi:AhpA/YtjB family protein [Alteromonas sp. BMJM2]|uniref:AhpA/YtjB family protein n=1 Tax=Alteromonas sp. BMJM2 TaxID=2954241 RepID=UPI0022B3BF37|nr:AhpA/YtjB family protein [Alteromonas sp. BMJM2]
MLAKAETNLLTSSTSHSHSLYTVVKRLLHTLLASLVIGLLVALLLLLQRYQEEWLLTQTEYSGSSAARQYAKLVSPILDTENDTAKALALKNIAVVLTQEPHVLGIAIFDERGQYIAPLPKTESVVTLSQSQEIRPLTFVESVVNDSDNVIGYVHIHMNTKVVLADPLALRTQLILIGVIVLFLALVIGIYLTRGFYKFRPWVINKIAQLGNVQSK